MHDKTNRHACPSNLPPDVCVFRKKLYLVMEQSVAFIIVSTAVRVISAGRPLSFCKKTDKVYDALALAVPITLLGIVIVGLRRHE